LLLTFAQQIGERHAALQSTTCGSCPLVHLQNLRRDLNVSDSIAKAATYPRESINNQTIDIGWRDGAKSITELAELIAQATGKRLSLWVIPWAVFGFMVRFIKPFSELGYDLMKMFLFFKTGQFVSDTRKQEQFLGPAPSAREAIDLWVASNNLKP
jgi:hypothetical protein